MAKASTGKTALMLIVVAACKGSPDEPVSRATGSPSASGPRAATTTSPPASTPAECHRRASAVLARGASESAWLRARPDLACACEGKIAQACTALGSSFGDDGAAPHDPAQANDGWMRGCDLGDGWGCTNYGTSLSKGRGVARDLTAAHARYRRGCDLGDGVGCSNAALQLANGRLGPPDLTGAKTLLKQGCDLGDATSCRHLSALH